ncbi:hypothetical protein BCV69DRAFT_53735 [Microstroma glucosiphilum]|uniref:Uncharacterized protein n=1 Tax=Pseudomicrostroma glucosiphilum TaxID=1684307 RepID=A0A316U0X6_9BASI|nr:hypothetical protein BCV69DRAFT_53735 [Pseudomicrostroma glucosiphilum]PWN18947.1 hypothetical protein BCV69DRAFT_53735 [Pseudomicrostroma glucosiphilum]
MTGHRRFLRCPFFQPREPRVRSGSLARRPRLRSRLCQPPAATRTRTRTRTQAGFLSGEFHGLFISSASVFTCESASGIVVRLDRERRGKV